MARAARGRRSLKYEAVYPYELVDGFEAERVIGAWMTFYSDRTSALGTWGAHAGRGLRRGAGSVTASTSSTLRPTTSGTLVAGFPRGRFSASPGTRVLSFSRASSTTSPADALRGFGPRGAREGAGDVGRRPHRALGAPAPSRRRRP